MQRCATVRGAHWRGCGSRSLLSDCSGPFAVAARCAGMWRCCARLEHSEYRSAKQENLGLKKQQLFQAVEGLQDAAGEWLSARAEQRAVQRDEEEPEWLVRAGQELELMLQQWQQRQEERLETEMKPQLDVAATPPSWGHQGRQAGSVATSPVGFVGLDQAASTSTHSRKSGGWQGAGKQGGGRQRKEKISRNAAARDAAAGRGGGPQAARAQSGDAQAEQDRMERQVRAEVWWRQGSWQRRCRRRGIRPMLAASRGVQQRGTTTLMSSSGNCAMQQVLRRRTFTGQHFGSRSQQGQWRRQFFGASIDGRG